MGLLAELGFAVLLPGGVGAAAVDVRGCCDAGGGLEVCFGA
jgi:hypothetical protein